MNDAELKTIIEKVLREMGGDVEPKQATAAVATAVIDSVADADLPDITTIDLRKDFHIENPHNKEAYMKLKQTTPARLGVGRAGTRYLTQTLIRFRADHAAARDAVLNEVPQKVLDDMNLFTVQTLVHDKDEYITRPDLGRIINDEGIKILKEKCKKKPSVEIYLTDGLSSTAIDTNGADTLAAIEQGLDGYGIDYGTPFFLKYGRVDSCDHVAEILEPKVVVVLIGERPGLVTSESMSCYMTYGAYRGIPQAKRTVISNIHRQGTPAAEAGAHIADVIKKMIDSKASGLDLKL